MTATLAKSRRATGSESDVAGAISSVVDRPGCCRSIWLATTVNSARTWFDCRVGASAGQEREPADLRVVEVILFGVNRWLDRQRRKKRCPRELSAVKALGGDADDGDVEAVECDRFVEDVRIGREGARPERMAQDD
jgi:hypothetical protein